MTWSHVLACFMGGAVLANFFPHFVAGVSGRWFPSPFAKPPFRGLSSPPVNVLWGLFNLAVAYILLVVAGNIELQRAADLGIAAAGFGIASLSISLSPSTQQSDSQ